MSNTSITNVEITDTFQVWISKTNDIIELANENVMLAGPGPGFTVSGNSTLLGSFTANTLVSETATTDNLSIINLSRRTTPNTPIESTSPIKITSQIENIFDLQTEVGLKPIIRLINGEDATWLVTHETPNSDSSITIKLQGAATPQLSLSQVGNLSVSGSVNASGSVSAPGFAGDGSLLTNLAVTAIPNLDASKITTGTFADARIPNLAASKITSGTFADARIPTNIARVDSIIRFNSIGVNTGASGTAGEIRATNNITAFFSDDRLKTRLGNIEEALKKINTLDAFYYVPNKTAIDLGYEEERYIGLSAQQVNEIFPEVVKPAPIDDKYLTIQYDKLIPLLVAGIKELRKQVDTMQKEIKEVKNDRT